MLFFANDMSKAFFDKSHVFVIYGGGKVVEEWVLDWIAKVVPNPALEPTRKKHVD